MSYDRNNTLDCKATKILALVHNDLAGPIQPLAKDGKDYKETFAPTINMASIRLLLQIAIQYDLNHYMDVKSAYLNAPLNEIYVEPTEGIE